MSDIAIRTEELTREFGSLRAVDRLSIEVEQGSIFGFLGPNGAGKTTTIQLLLGLLEPTSGRAEVLGHDVRGGGDQIRARVGALLEQTGLYEQLTAADNLKFYSRVYGMSSDDRRKRMMELLGRMGAWERRKERVGIWSKGMKQRLALARTLFHRPELIFLDEPTAGLDVVAAGAVRDELRFLVRREGTTVFLTTHNMAEAEKLCDQVAVIQKGQLLWSGPTAELRARGSERLEIRAAGLQSDDLAALRGLPEVEAAELDQDRLLINLAAGSDSAPIVSFLVGRGAQVGEVRRGAANLEDALLSLLGESES